ncbi:MAG: helix-turn-helix transcriptional regulator [Clostridia bacterium]|nr:helix-turn-helix transcriptional regulator [Clostridia bacterium]
MKGYFELQQDYNKKVAISSGPEFFILPHFHQKIEIFMLVEGTYTVTRNGVSYNLNSGDIIIFDCYDIHSYEHKNGDVKGIAIIIPPKVAPEFFSRKDGKQLASPIISNPELCQKLYDIVVNFVKPKENGANLKASAGALALYLLEPYLTYVDSGTNDETALAKQLLIYVNENFKTDINLKMLAKKFGYSVEHLSRVFNRYVKSSLPNYVNGLRHDYINEELKKNPKQNITTLLFSAGFKSVQTYYRTKPKKN